MRLQLYLALAGLSANLADARLANFFSKCNTEAELLSYEACSDAMHTSVKKTCDPMTNFSDCACVFGTSMVATCVTILCPPDVATSYTGVGCATRGVNTEDFGGQATQTAAPGAATGAGANATPESTGGPSSNNGASGSGSGADGLIIPVAVVLAGAIGGLAALL